MKAELKNGCVHHLWTKVQPAANWWKDKAIFINDLRARIVNRPQITTDAFAAYYGAIRRAWDSQV